MITNASGSVFSILVLSFTTSRRAVTEYRMLVSPDFWPLFPNPLEPFPSAPFRLSGDPAPYSVVFCRNYRHTGIFFYPFEYKVYYF